jgi:hypothetical protein
MSFADPLPKERVHAKRGVRPIAVLVALRFNHASAGALRPATPPRNRTAAQTLSLSVRQIKLPNTTPRVIENDPNLRAFALFNLLPGLIRHQNGLLSHSLAPFREEGP